MSHLINKFISLYILVLSTNQKDLKQIK